MKTTTITLRRAIPSMSSDDGFVAKVTVSAPPFDVPSARDLQVMEREVGAAMRSAGREVC